MNIISSSAGRLAAVSVILLMLLVACNRNDDGNKTVQADVSPATAANSKAMVTDARYVCPMHPHIQQHGPGACPICGMTLVKKTVTAPADPAPELQNKSDEKKPDGTDAKSVLYYYDPMRPEEHFDKPGPSPFMDMQLVPKYADAGGSDGGGITVSAAVIQSLGIRTANPQRRDVRPRIRVPARVVADAQGQARVQARVNGWIERLHVRAVGQQVSRGMVIADIYSPELIQAQEEMLLGAETAGPAAERLRRFGIADGDIQAVRRAGKASRRLPLRAMVGGVVTEIGVREGSSVTPDTVILDLAARSAVWIEAQLFPSQRFILGNTMQAWFSLPGLPGHEWLSQQGTVVPVVDSVTQTLAVRFSVDNSDDLALGTVLDGDIEGTTRSDVLLLPASSVIRTAQGDRVMVLHGKNRFMAMPVKLGQRYGNDIEIIEGLAETDRVVTSGQFLLDAEANLQSGFSSMEMDDKASMKGSQP
ncbi:MAG: efflux RND transporter periplasmic adaptor subunit [Arenimonas sp.]